MSRTTQPSGSSEVDRHLGIAGLHHIGISTLDLDGLAEFYKETFGFEVVAELAWDPGFDDIDAALALVDSSGRMAMLRLGEVYIELFEFTSPRPEPTDLAQSVTDVGINHLCLLVEDIHTILDRLDAVGVPVHSSARDIGDGPFVYCRDPDGNAIEFWQLPPTSPEEET